MKSVLIIIFQHHKIPWVVNCKQSRWLKPAIDLNSKLRTDAKNDWEKGLYKLMNNAILGETMEIVEKHMEYKLVVNKKEQ